MTGGAPQSEAEVQWLYHLVQMILLERSSHFHYEGKLSMKHGCEFIRLVDEERAERDHREPGPLSG